MFPILFRKYSGSERNHKEIWGNQLLEIVATSSTLLEYSQYPMLQVLVLNFTTLWAYPLSWSLELQAQENSGNMFKPGRVGHEMRWTKGLCKSQLYLGHQAISILGALGELGKNMWAKFKFYTVTRIRSHEFKMYVATGNRGNHAWEYHVNTSG